MNRNAQARRYLMRAAMSAGVAAIFLAAQPAHAADLGGNCCADLEERIAELEATTSTKGNTRVTLTARHVPPHRRRPVIGPGVVLLPRELSFGRGSFSIAVPSYIVPSTLTIITPGTAFAFNSDAFAIVDASSFVHEHLARRNVLSAADQTIGGVLDGAIACTVPADEAATSTLQQCSKRGVWAVALGGYADIDATGSAFSGEQTLVGGLAGALFGAAPGITLGFFGGYAQTELKTEYDAERIETSFGIAGAFARLRNAQSFADLSVTGLWNDSDRRREIHTEFGSEVTFKSATATANGWLISPALTVGLRMPVTGDTTLVPALKVRGTFGQEGGFSETGSASNFTAAARDIADFEGRVELGFHRSFAVDASRNGLVRATAGLSYFGAFGDDTINGTLLGQTISFSSGAPKSEFGGYVGVGLDVPLSASASMFADTEMHLTDRAQSISGFGGVKVKF